jgi:hypothetical protein
MELLPDDALIDVFKYLDVKSKLNLMRVCSRFDDVISNSMKLMQNIKVEMKFYIINKRADVVKRARLFNWNPILSSERKYQNLKITHLDDPCFSVHGKNFRFMVKYMGVFKSYNWFFRFLKKYKNVGNIWKKDQVTQFMNIPTFNISFSPKKYGIEFPKINHPNSLWKIPYISFRFDGDAWYNKKALLNLLYRRKNIGISQQIPPELESDWNCILPNKLQLSDSNFERFNKFTGNKFRWRQYKF